MDFDDEDEPRDPPAAVIGAVAAGVAPVPFLAVYAVLFIARGTVRPVIPPDIGDSKGDELIAGLVALVLFVAFSLAAHWFLDGRRRWLFVATQLLTFGASLYFVINTDASGSLAVPILLLVTSVLALVLSILPPSWRHMRREIPGWLDRGRRRPDPPVAS